MYTEIAYDTREYDSVAENGFVSTADRPLSTFAADRDTASYSNVRSYIESGCLPTGRSGENRRDAELFYL